MSKSKRASVIGSFPAFVEMRDGSFRSAQDGKLYALPKGVMLELDGRWYRLAFKKEHIYKPGETKASEITLQVWVPGRRPQGFVEIAPRFVRPTK